MITGKTRLICSLGDPVSHSLSPMIHNTGFEHLNLDYAFLAFNTKLHQVEDTFAALKRLNARGFSCTMPIKVRVSELTDELSPAAELMGAVNTAIIEGDKVYGYNTDGIGFTTTLKEAGCDFVGKKVTILGGGGAATAMAVQIALEGAAEVSIFTRPGKSADRASALAEKIKAKTNCLVNTYDFSDGERLKTEIAESCVLANGTPVGMAPNTDASPITDLSVFHKDLLVMDAIYNPRETKLVQDAKSCGCQALGGLSMLLHQGAAAFKLWTGEDLPVDLIKEKLFK